MMKVEPVVLEGARVRLEPLSLTHHAALCEVGLDPELWRWTTTNCTTPDEMRSYIETALQEQRAGKSLPFATVDKLSNRVVGSTRFSDIDRKNRGVEIGWTWIAREFQRTHVNTEAKYLMLKVCVRDLALHSSLSQDRRAQRKIAPRHSTHRRDRRRHASQSHDHAHRTHPRHRLFQHH